MPVASFNLAGSSRSGTLTVSGTTGLRKAQCRRHRPARIAPFFPSGPSTINPQQSTAFSGIGGLLARSELSTLNPQLSTAYYHSDANGNITCLVDGNGTVVARYAYDPYGNILSMSGSLAEANLYRFSSKEAHANSDLVYYLYRYYDPNLQRWVNQDPIGEEGGINLYEFCYSDPLNQQDVFGHCIPFLIEAGAVAAGVSTETVVTVGGAIVSAVAAVGVHHLITAAMGGSGAENAAEGAYYSNMSASANAPSSLIVGQDLPRFETKSWHNESPNPEKTGKRGDHKNREDGKRTKKQRENEKKKKESEKDEATGTAENWWDKGLGRPPYSGPPKDGNIAPCPL